MLKHLQYGLQDSFEKQGLWWLPREQDNEIGGTLSYDGEGHIRLELVGAFGSLPPTNQLLHTDVIHGITADGIECTLCHNQGSLRINSPGIFCQEFSSKLLLLGYYFNTVEDLLFTAYEVNYDYLEEWLDRSPYDFDVKYGKNKFEYHVFWPSRLFFKAHVPVIEGEISISTSLYTTENSSKAVRLEHDAYLKYQPTRPHQFERCRRLFFDLQHLLTLLFGESTYPRKIRAYLDKEGEMGSINWPVSVYYNLPTSLSTKRLYHHEMLVSFSALSEQFPKFLDKWLANTQRLRHVFSLFFSALYKPDMYLENRFLNLVNALESYHRAMAEGQYVTDDEYDRYYEVLVGAIPRDAPKELRDALAGKLKYGNEFSLSKRLKELFRDLGNELAELVTPKPKQFVRQVVNTRNYLTHHDEDLEKRTLNSEEMFYACQRLRILLTVLLLKSLGIEDLQIKEIVSKNRRIQPWDI